MISTGRKEKIKKNAFHEKEKSFVLAGMNVKCPLHSENKSSQFDSGC